MMDHFELNIKGRPGPEPGDMTAMRVLNRIVRITEESLLYEPNPRPVELLVKALQLQDARPAATPGIKDNVLEDLPAKDDADVQNAFPSGHAHKKTVRVSIGLYRICSKHRSCSVPCPSRSPLDRCHRFPRQLT